MDILVKYAYPCYESTHWHRQSCTENSSRQVKSSDPNLNTKQSAEHVVKFLRHCSHKVQSFLSISLKSLTFLFTGHA